MNQTTLTAHIYGFANMEANTINHIRKVRDRVEYLLEKYPSTRGDDRILLYRYYKTFEPEMMQIKFKAFSNMLRATNPETIRRRRQEWNQEGKYLPTKKTRIKRARREEIIREYEAGK